MPIRSVEALIGGRDLGLRGNPIGETGEGVRLNARDSDEQEVVRDLEFRYRSDGEGQFLASPAVEDVAGPFQSDDGTQGETVPPCGAGRSVLLDVLFACPRRAGAGQN